jgi:hypothetical protein
MTVTGPTRELACLALAHDDTGEVRCPATDEQLMRELVAEVQRLRVAAGEVEPTVVDEQEQIGVLDDALGTVGASWATGTEAAERMLGVLTDAGWRLAPVLRP